MSETTGQLIDRLITVDLKLWHVQDQVHKAAAETPEEYMQRAPEDTHGIFQKLKSLNLERTSLIREIDEAIAEGVATGQVPVAGSIKIL